MWRTKQNILPPLLRAVFKEFSRCARKSCSLLCCWLPWRHGNATSCFDVKSWFLLLNNDCCTTMNSRLLNAQMIGPEACNFNQGIHTDPWHTEPVHILSFAYIYIHINKSTLRYQHMLHFTAISDRLRYVWPKRSFGYGGTDKDYLLELYGILVYLMSKQSVAVIGKRHKFCVSCLDWAIYRTHLVKERVLLNIRL